MAWIGGQPAPRSGSAGDAHRMSEARQRSVDPCDGRDITVAAWRIDGDRVGRIRSWSVVIATSVLCRILEIAVVGDVDLSIRIDRDALRQFELGIRSRDCCDGRDIAVSIGRIDVYGIGPTWTNTAI